MVGDRWRATDFGDGPERFDTQLTLMNARAAGPDRGRELNLRGVNAKVMRGGVLAQGDAISSWAPGTNGRRLALLVGRVRRERP